MNYKPIVQILENTHASVSIEKYVNEMITLNCQLVQSIITLETV